VTDNVVPAAGKPMRRLLSLGSLPPPFAFGRNFSSLLLTGAVFR
jgi:hypothetical protein